MTGETEALWDHVNALRDKQAALEARMAAHDAKTDALAEKIDLSRQERTEQFKVITEQIATLGETVKEELSEYRGALKFGKWIAGTLIALGVPAGMLAMWGGHR